MKMIRIKMIFGLVVASFALLQGCTSYRFAGEVFGAGNSVDNVLKGKYKIAYLKWDILRGTGQLEIRKILRKNQNMFYQPDPDPWSIPQTASFAQEDQLLSLIQYRYPSVFAPDAKELLIVKVTLVEEHTEGLGSIVIPYLASLGILPFFQTVHSECQVDVQRASDGSLLGTSVANYNADMMASVSPIGAMIGYERVPSAQFQIIGSGVFKGPHLNKSVAIEAQTIFAEAVATAVVSILKQVESK